MTGCPDCDKHGLCDKHKLEYLEWVHKTAHDEYEAELRKQITETDNRNRTKTERELK